MLRSDSLHSHSSWRSGTWPSYPDRSGSLRSIGSSPSASPYTAQTWCPRLRESLRVCQYFGLSLKISLFCFLRSPAEPFWPMRSAMLAWLPTYSASFLSCSFLLLLVEPREEGSFVGTQDTSCYNLEYDWDNQRTRRDHTEADTASRSRQSKSHMSCWLSSLLSNHSWIDLFG